MIQEIAVPRVQNADSAGFVEVAAGPKVDDFDNVAKSHWVGQEERA